MKISIKKTIKGNRETIWPLLSDFANICKYHPMIKKSYTVLQPNSKEVGAVRHCDLARGKYLEEKLVEFVEGSHYVAELYDSNFPIRAAVSTFKIEAIDENKSKVMITVDMGTEYLIMKPMMYLFFKFGALPKIIRNIEKASKENSKMAKWDAQLNY